jgi:DNA (cytosine-5)-methyltransferase 1
MLAFSSRLHYEPINEMSFSAIELCAGGGGQALGLEMAGFHHEALVEYEENFCCTLRKNRPRWNTYHEDIRNFAGEKFTGIDLLAGGVPCPPFSIAGKQLGADDDRDMFPAAISLIQRMKPRAVLLENVPGLASARFAQYRNDLLVTLAKLGYQPEWKVLQAADYGVPQLRPRFVLIALRPKDAEFFEWPEPSVPGRNVGDTIVDLMGANGWSGARLWSRRAMGIAPTIVGGSKKHGGPDLGPTRAKSQWRHLGVDGMGIANEAPDKAFPVEGLPRLTVAMVARIQSFPDDWEFMGSKTSAYRQVGNAFPPLVARAVGLAIHHAFKRRRLPLNGSAHRAEMRLLEEYNERKKACQRKKARSN